MLLLEVSFNCHESNGWESTSLELRASWTNAFLSHAIGYQRHPRCGAGIYLPYVLLLCPLVPGVVQWLVHRNDITLGRISNKGCKTFSAGYLQRVSKGKQELAIVARSSMQKTRNASLGGKLHCFCTHWRRLENPLHHKGIQKCELSASSEIKGGMCWQNRESAVMRHKWLASKAPAKLIKTSVHLHSSYVTALSPLAWARLHDTHDIIIQVHLSYSFFPFLHPDSLLFIPLQLLQ